MVGENGAGKSTLCKIVAGVYTRDSGTILVDGQEVDIQNPRDAHGFGIAMVQQEPQLVPTLTVAENLGYARGNLPFHVSRGKLNLAAEQLMDELNVNISPRTKAANLSVPDRQMVEIAKALTLNSKLIILDEPTAALSYREEQDALRHDPQVGGAWRQLHLCVSRSRRDLRSLRPGHRIKGRGEGDHCRG